MYVCFCRGITDGDIRNAISKGASDFNDVREELGVGTQCGKCARLANEVISDVLDGSSADSNGLFYNVA
ncbi:bacterioferritin-associated ferredoxin [Alteromonadaceae bacterium Bs31]|nr:bacterioferritin-associated ferredoxin [Alteromonadaceae bacterium Bs31]